MVGGKKAGRSALAMAHIAAVVRNLPGVPKSPMEMGCACVPKINLSQCCQYGLEINDLLVQGTGSPRTALSL